MFKNVASQKLVVYAFDTTTGAPKTGDAANLTAYVSKDYGAVTVLGDTSATEMDATNAAGSYLFDLTQTESNADSLYFTGKSSTANIKIVPQWIFTDPPSYTSFVTPTNLTAAQIATGVWQDTTAADFTTALSVGKSVMNGVSLGTGLTVNDITTKTGYALTSGERTSIADAMLDETNGVETSWTVRQFFRIIFAALAGKADGMGTTTGHFRDQADTKNRITATIDANGNRTAVTLDAS